MRRPIGSSGPSSPMSAGPSRSLTGRRTRSAWAKTWLDHVRAKTGVTPGIYASKSVLFSHDWTSVAKDYPLWVVQYPNYDDMGFKGEPWTDGWGFGTWDAPLVFQYTSSGRIAGYGGHLDLDLCYGDADDWRRRCAVAGTPAGTGEEVEEAAVDRANVAVQIMEHLVTCPEHGYSQAGRHGTSGCCDVQTDAGTIKVRKGDRDCSSAVCEAWELALKGTRPRGQDHTRELDRQHARDVRGKRALLVEADVV